MSHKPTRRIFLNQVTLTSLICTPLITTSAFAQSQEGIAVHYSNYFHGKPVASGETYDKDQLTGSMNRYPYGTMVRVTNLENDKSVVVKINDRMRTNSKVLIDLSLRAAQDLDFIREGKARVRVERVDQ